MLCLPVVDQLRNHFERFVCNPVHIHAWNKSSSNAACMAAKVVHRVINYLSMMVLNEAVIELSDLLAHTQCSAFLPKLSFKLMSAK